MLGILEETRHKATYNNNEKVKRCMDAAFSYSFWIHSHVHTGRKNTSPNINSWKIKEHYCVHTHTQTTSTTTNRVPLSEVIFPPFCLPSTLPLPGIIAAWLLVWKSEQLRSLVALNIRHSITFKGLISMQSQALSQILPRQETQSMLLFLQAMT